MIGHAQCHNSGQNSFIISPIFSKDTVLASCFIKNIYVVIRPDIEIGLESSDETVPL